MKLTKKNILEIMAYIFEIILTVLFSIEILKIVCDRKNLGNFPLGNIIVAIIIGIILLCIIIYLYKLNKNKIEKLFLTIILVVGTAFSMFMLPYNVPDEGAHIIKAYDISVGHFLPKIDENNWAFCIFPEDAKEYDKLNFNNYNDVANKLSQEIDYSKEVKLLTSSQNIFILYIGPVIAFLIGRILNIKFLYLIYLGRIFNLLIYSVFGYFSIKKIPLGKLVLAVFLCVPMMVQQAASCSADAILNSVLIFYISYMLSIILEKQDLNIKDRVIIYICTILIAIFKYVYIVVAGILFVLIFSKNCERKKSIKTCAIMIILGGIFCVGWYIYGTTFKSVPADIEEFYKDFGINSSEQIKWLSNNPFKYVKILIKEFRDTSVEYGIAALGQNLGWLDFKMNSWLIFGFFSLLVLSIVSENNKYEITLKIKIWFLLLYLLMSILVKTGMYIFSTPVGYDKVLGVQGRYYSPILILLLLLPIKKENYLKMNFMYEKIMGGTLFLNAVLIVTMMLNYL